MRETKVLFTWKVNEELKAFFNENLSPYSSIDLIFPNEINSDTLNELVEDCQIAIGWRPNIDFLKSGKQLDLFINPGAGVQNLIDLFKEINTTHQLQLINGHGNSYFTAQGAVALLHTLVNRIILHHNWMIQGYWRKGDSDAASYPLRHKKVGLLGFGAINQKVNKFLSGYDLSFSALRNEWRASDEIDFPDLKKFNKAELDEFFNFNDIVIIALPQTEETQNLITKKQLELLGSNGILVNVARGPVVNEKDLFDVLKNKLIFGAAIDVWYNYDPEEKDGKKYPYNFPFHELDNVVLSPHRAASPFSDLERWLEVVENIKRYTNEETRFLNMVNLEKGY